MGNRAGDARDSRRNPVVFNLFNGNVGTGEALDHKSRGKRYGEYGLKKARQGRSRTQTAVESLKEPKPPNMLFMDSCPLYLPMDTVTAAHSGPARGEGGQQREYEISHARDNI